MLGGGGFEGRMLGEVKCEASKLSQVSQSGRKLQRPD